MKERATAIILSGTNTMFVELMIGGKLCRVFVGGGIEEGESPAQAALRELEEEANVTGTILHGPVPIKTKSDFYSLEHGFVIDIGAQAPSLGHDPELPPDQQDLKGIVWADLAGGEKIFNDIDLLYVTAILDDAAQKNVGAPWVKLLKDAAAQ